jgi:NADPH:quinone reductase-like Zn-dependent oxidoreductase
MPTPKPEAHELLIKVKATTVTAVDSIFRKGNSIFPRMATGLMRPGIPVLGTELSGVVEEVGDKVTGFRPGDEVIADSGTSYGAHAEYVCISEKEPVIKKPGNITFQEAAALCYGGLTALSFLRDSGEIKKGSRILVIGASGSVGSSAIQLAAYLGADVTGMCSTANIDLVRSLGADHIIDYTKTSWDEIDQTFDIIFDSVGKYSLKTCRHLLTEHGRYLTTVLSAGSVGDMLRTKMIGKKKSILSFTGLRSAEDKMKDLEFLSTLVESGDLKPVIDRSYELAHIEEAFQYVDLGHKKGNVVITVS